MSTPRALLFLFCFFAPGAFCLGRFFVLVGCARGLLPRAFFCCCARGLLPWAFYLFIFFVAAPRVFCPRALVPRAFFLRRRALSLIVFIHVYYIPLIFSY